MPVCGISLSNGEKGQENFQMQKALQTHFVCSALLYVQDQKMPNQTMPWASMASATLTKPAMFAPTT